MDRRQWVVALVGTFAILAGTAVRSRGESDSPPFDSRYLCPDHLVTIHKWLSSGDPKVTALLAEGPLRQFRDFLQPYVEGNGRTGLAFVQFHMARGEMGYMERRAYDRKINIKSGWSSEVVGRLAQVIEEYFNTEVEVAAYTESAMKGSVGLAEGLDRLKSFERNPFVTAERLSMAMAAYNQTLELRSKEMANLKLWDPETAERILAFQRDYGESAELLREYWTRSSRSFFEKSASARVSTVPKLVVGTKEWEVLLVNVDNDQAAEIDKQIQESLKAQEVLAKFLDRVKVDVVVK